MGFLVHGFLSHACWMIWLLLNSGAPLLLVTQPSLKGATDLDCGCLNERNFASEVAFFERIYLDVVLLAYL